MIVAPVRAGRTEALRSVLARMNLPEGGVDARNPLVPFADFDRLHFARFVVLEDRTTADLAMHGAPVPVYPDSLAFLGDCDGPAPAFLRSVCQQAEAGLREIFAHCEGFEQSTNLFLWLQKHRHSPATAYVNWLGRTTRQIREEKRLREFLESQLGDGSAWKQQAPGKIHAALRDAVCTARLMPAAEAPTPLGWRITNLLHVIAVPLALLLMAPPLILLSPFLLWTLRRRERHDPEIDLTADWSHLQSLADLEDHQYSNQFTALGSVKPGLFRRWLLVIILWGLNYTTRHIFNRGHLTRVKTIHFARWVFLDNRTRLFFASNYNGSLESYMDDFINKVGWGLNLVFSNGVGYPRTNWLVFRGAGAEQKFKRYIRRHQLPTEVWYNAHPGLTNIDMETNTRIRQGLEKTSLTDSEAAEWLRLF